MKKTVKSGSWSKNCYDGRIIANILITTVHISLCCLLHVSLGFGTKFTWIVATNIFAIIQKHNIMWPDLRKGVFHTHPIYQLWQFATSDCYKPLMWNLISRKHQHSFIAGKSFNFIRLLIAKLRLLNLDVCGRPPFANLVTY